MLIVPAFVMFAAASPATVTVAPTAPVVWVPEACAFWTIPRIDARTRAFVRGEEEKRARSETGLRSGRRSSRLGNRADVDRSGGGEADRRIAAVFRGRFLRNPCLDRCARERRT